ncbi:peptidoglycan-binding domain-containing protein [Streptomyces sp. NPDC001904]|uniref:peptidoglycan-binding domain-containing protein n=1 Tax=Streptomyces sp. NPDC001904 TaxID=3154531 RepID=UPI0033325E51
MDDEYGAPGPRRGRRGPILIVGGFVLVAAVSTVGALGLGGGGSDDDSAVPGRSGQAVRVTRETLTDQTEVDGQLGHGLEVPFPVKAEGTITWLPEQGATVRRGQPVLRVDDRPVTLMYGSLPMYRGLAVATPTDRSSGTEKSGGSGESGGSEGSVSSGGPARPSDPGAPGGATRSAATTTPLRGMDVKQFETNLAALGYSGFTVDEAYNESTAAAVKRWQRDLGVPQTGKVGIGDVLYAPGTVRIAGTSAQVGAAATGSPVTYTTTRRMVTVNAAANEVGWAQRGTTVDVDLPDGTSVKGTVASVGKDASGAGSGSDAGGDGGGGGGSGSGDKAATVVVVVTFANQASLGRLQSGPVTVRYVSKRHKDVLAVPVAALVALAEGGYGVEPANGEEDAGGGPAGRFVPVKTGLFADGKVEISGRLVREGMTVRIPE